MLKYKVKYWRGVRANEAPAVLEFEAGDQQAMEGKLRKMIGWQTFDQGNFEVLEEGGFEAPAPKIKEEPKSEEAPVEKLAEEVEEQKKKSKNLICAECGSEAKSELGLKIHMSRKHKE